MARFLRGGRISPSSRWEPYFAVQPTAYDLVIDVDSPVSHWKLGDPNTAVDRKGALNIPAVGGPIATTPGLVSNNGSDRATTFLGTQFFYPGSSSYPALYPNATWTIEFWVNPRVAADYPLVQKASGGATGIYLNSNRSLTLSQFDATSAFQFCTTAANLLTLGQTYHIAGTFDGSTLRLYVNGTLAASEPCAGAITDAAAPQIGANISTNNHDLDEVAWYSSALSPARVLAHYQAGIAPPAVAARYFSGQFTGDLDSITLASGAIGTIGSGAFTILVLIKPTSLFFGYPMVVQNSDGSVALEMLQLPDASNVNVNNSFTGGSAPLALSTTDWQILAVTRPAGTSVFRVHQSILGSGSWQHVDSTAAINGPTNAAGRVVIGQDGGGGNYQQMYLAVAGVWNRELSDAQVASITNSTASIRAVAGGGPDALWQFNQDDILTPVTDLIGGGADQTAIHGTTVNPIALSGWTYDPNPAAVTANKLVCVA